MNIFSDYVGERRAVSDPPVPLSSGRIPHPCLRAVGTKGNYGNNKKRKMQKINKSFNWLTLIVSPSWQLVTCRC